MTDRCYLYIFLERVGKETSLSCSLTGRWICLALLVLACVFVSQVLKGQRRACHRVSFFRPGANTQNFRDVKLKKIYDTWGDWGYTCLTCTTCHLSYITSLIIPHARRLNLRHNVTDAKSFYLKCFDPDDRLVYCLIYWLAQRPETL